ncbi:MAG: signal peptide protein [Mycobacterium sp.]|nr:signal peptide protein [Mycobacterium sp.]
MIDIGAKVLGAAIGGGFAALVFASPAAAEPVPPPPPAPVVDGAPVPAAPAQAAPAPPPPEGVPHLASPDALPPGSTMDPSVMAGGESPNVSYLRDLWHAVQNQELSGKEALLLGISQRNLNTPIPAQAPGPNVPVTPGDPAPAPAAPAPPAPAPAAPAAP